MSRLRIVSFCVQLLVFVAIPVILLVHLRQGATLRSFGDRLGFGLSGGASKNANQKAIWFHAASLGEVKQIEAVAGVLKAEHGYHILITTFTHAGAKWVRQNLPYATHKYAPIDIGIVVQKYMRAFKPCLLVLVEGDIWPNMINATKNSGTSIALVNARSSRSRSRFSKLYGEVTKKIDLITVPSLAVAEEFLTLGAERAKVHVVDSLKSSKMNVDHGLTRGFTDITGDRKIWAVASSHRSDEDLIYQVLEQSKSSCLTIWAPRHLSRVSAIEKQLEKMALKWAKRSNIADAASDIDVLILDSLGELGSVFDVADAVYLGGGQANEGGHNPFEPAMFGVPIISGPNIENHREAFNAPSVQPLVTFATTSEGVKTWLQSVLNAQDGVVVGPDFETENEAVTQTVRLLLNR